LRKILKTLEFALIILTLLQMTGGPLLIILAGGVSEGEIAPELDSTLVQYVFSGFYFFLFFFTLPHWKKIAYLLMKEKWLILLMGLAILSVFWTTAPEVTPRRLVGLVGTTMVGFYLAARYDLKQQMDLLAWTMGIAIGLSFMFALLLPRYGVMGGLHAGDWRGIYYHKNVLGKIMTLSITLFWLLLRHTKGNPISLWLGLIFSSLLLILTTSTSSIINAMALVISSGVLATLGWRYRLMIPTVLLMLVISSGLSFWASQSAEFIFSLFGKDATLTGRTDIWLSVIRMINQHPWWGYGFSGFWNGRLSEAATVWRDVRWHAPHSHNGYLDLWLDLGFVGVALFTISFWNALLRSIVWIRLVKTPDQLWPIMFLIYFTLANVTESSLLSQNNIYWVFYVAIALSLRSRPETVARLDLVKIQSLAVAKPI
jgi:exopolysaccharide production protein ExoQ